MLNNMFKMYEPAEEDEENAINVVIGPEMSKDDVVKEILNKVQAYEKQNIFLLFNNKNQKHVKIWA